MSKRIQVPPEAIFEPEVIQVANFLEVSEDSIKELIDDYLKPEYTGVFKVDLISIDGRPSSAKISAMKGGQLHFLIWIQKNGNQLSLREIIAPGQISERRKVPIPEVEIGQTLLIETEEGNAYKLKIISIARTEVGAKLSDGSEGTIHILKEGEASYFCGKARGIIKKGGITSVPLISRKD